MKVKRLLNLLLCTALVFALLSAAPARAAIWSGGATQPPGVGTPQSPYQISTGEHLKWFANQINNGNTAGYANLIANIVLNDTSNLQNWATSPPANTWTPIGNAANRFKGIFNGQGYTVSGVYINCTSSYQGLFGCIGTDGAGTVKNVKVANSYIKGQDYVGGICGEMYFFSTISGCESGATIIGNDYSGGITGSIAKNASLSNCRNTGNVTGMHWCAGGIAGHNNGTLLGCVNQGPVTGVGQISSLGGLVGLNYSVLSNSYSSGSVSASGNYIGGVCGINGSGGAVTNVYNAGSVTGGWPVCGYAQSGSSLANVYFSGASASNGIGANQGTGKPVNKSAEQFASGEVAYLMGTEYGQTLGSGGDPLPVFRASDNSNEVYRLTYMNGTAVHAVQYYNAGATVSSDSITSPTMDDGAFSHWEGLPNSMPAQDVTVTANSTPAAPTITTTSLPSGAAYKAFSAQITATGTKPITFTLHSGALPAGLTLNGATGEITGTPTEAGSSIVTIRAQNAYGYGDKQFSIDISDEMPGSGTSSDPYKIWKASHLIQFADKVNKATATRFYAVLMADLELNNTSDWENWDTDAPANTWIPIGINQTYNFKGGFDGNNHTISGLYINSSEDHQGLFGYISAATTVKNLNLAKSYIKGKDNVGGICGTLINLCRIENCRSAVAVRGEKYAGGVCGNVVANNASIFNCHNDGAVTGSECVGGIAGINSGTISGCRNSGTVQSSGSGRSIGGICGNSNSAISNAYNTGSVSGNLNIGGICGVLGGLASKSAMLTNVYNSGSITGPSNSAAICGATNVYCALSNCYYLSSSAVSDIGFNAGTYTTVSKSVEQFASGEVAYLLGTAFGQTLGAGGDSLPVFRTSDNGNAVYQLTYMNETQQHAVQYYNAGATVSAAGVAVPKKSGHCFSHWEALPASMPTGDATTTAVFVPIKAPSAPQGLTATPGDGQVTLSWMAPADDGGSAIIGHEVSKDNGANWTNADSDTGHTFTALTNGQSYMFGVRAVNDAGSGAAATTSATPQVPAIVTVTSVTVKTAPTKTTYTAGDSLDLSGLVVTLHKSDSNTEDVAFADFATCGITTSPANGATLSASNTAVTITYTADSQSVSQSITVNPAPVTDASISPDTGSFDKYAPDDILTNVTWGNATGVTDVKAGGSSIGSGNYSVSADTLTIKKEYLVAQATGSLVLTVEFNAGASVTLAVTISDTTPPTINYASRHYDLSAPADVRVTITWNSASSVTDVVYSVSPDTTLYTLDTDDYTIAGDNLTIKNSFFSGLSLAAGTALDFDINFNTGATAALAVNIVDGYVPSSNADLSSLSVNDTPVSGFDPDDTEYDVELPYGSSSATIKATKSDPNAGYTVSPAPTLPVPGTATVMVTAEDATTTKTYKIYITIGAAPIVLVTSITVTGMGGVSSVQAGSTLQMLADVSPAHANNRNVTWSISESGANISTTGLLTATAAGTVTVRAAAQDGSGVYGEKVITITAMPVTTYTVTFNSNGSIYAVKTVNAGDSIGRAAWPPDPVRNSYTFGGWFTGENGTGTRFTSEMPVNATMTIYAKWTYSGGAGGGSSRSTPATPTYKATVSGPNISRTTLPVSVNTNTVSATIDLGTTLAKDIFTGSGTAVLTVPSIPGVNSYTLGIPAASLSGSQGEDLLTFSTSVGSVTIPSGMLAEMVGTEGSSAGITIAQGDKSGLPDEVKAAIGDKPLIQLTLSIEGKQTDWNNPDAPVTVSIPYTPTAAELANPESIVIWYIDGSGNVVTIPNGHYDPATGMVTFTTTHFSYYAVSFKQVSFKDVAKDAWYAKSVSFIAAREIATGTGCGNFSPEAKLTRGQFIVMLMKAYGIAPDANPKNSFADAGNTWYTGYLAAAKRLGISAGVGSNIFAPEKEITRQEMFTLLYNALKAIGQLPQGDSGKTLSDFTDVGQIEAWAKEAMTLLIKTGIIGGSNGELNPASTTTRAEMVQVLYNLLGK
jgi:uncharacterized repeat protein (TIGR02543 family)